MEPRLETFLMLCQTMHYGHAAERLNLSQPAVSKHIQSLEAQYGVTLFTYANRRLHKTRQGEILEQYAQSLQYNEQGLLNKLREEQIRSIRVGATKSIGDYVLYPYIRQFLTTREHAMELLVDNTEHLLHLLDAGKLDFVLLEGIFDKQHYDWSPFREEPYIGICARNHPFAGREVAFQELLKERIILREEGSGTRNILEQQLAGMGYAVDAFQQRISISSFEIIKKLVQEDLGISFLYEAVARDNTELACFSCPPLTGKHEFNIVYLKNTQAAAVAGQFLAELHRR